MKQVVLYARVESAPEAEEAAIRQALAEAFTVIETFPSVIVVEGDEGKIWRLLEKFPNWRLFPANKVHIDGYKW